ncbi:hypothetical protein [Streptomyces sp.]|uniref:hypothetical protein n=1 Tax=Streptomyces sp. TaxID=1931 RepID=UPI002F3F507A
MSKTPRRRPRPPAPASPRKPGSTTASPASPAVPAGPPPLRLNLAAAVAALEGLALAGWGVTTFFTGGETAILAGLLILVLAGFPLAAAYGLRRARRWSRGPALIMQLLSLPVAWTMLHSTGAVIAGGAALGALALSGLVLLVHPATTDALGIKRTASS